MNKCLYCGNNQVSHKALWFVQTSQMFSAPMFSFFEKRNPKKINYINEKVSPKILRALSAIRFVRFSSDLHDSLNERSEVVWNEAIKRGLNVRQVQFFGNKSELYEVRANGQITYYSSMPIRDSQNGTQSWLDDKGRLKLFLKSRNLPTPNGYKVSRVNQALEAFDKLEKPLIVKPAVGSRGRHTTTFLYTKEDFLLAYRRAKQICYSVIIDEMMMGSVYRATVIDGITRGILRGDSPSIFGDGKKTVKQLIEQKNKSKPEGVHDVVITKKTVEFLGHQGYKLSDVPLKNKQVFLSEKIGIRYGGDAVDDTDNTHPKIIEIMNRAGRELGLSVIGIDFIIPKINEDPTHQKWGIIEANTLPFIDLHHFPRAGKPINVAKYVWDAYLS